MKTMLVLLIAAVMAGCNYVPAREYNPNSTALIGMGLSMMAASQPRQIRNAYIRCPNPYSPCYIQY